MRQLDAVVIEVDHNRPDPPLLVQSSANIT